MPRFNADTVLYQLHEYTLLKHMQPPTHPEEIIAAFEKHAVNQSSTYASVVDARKVLNSK